LVARIGLTAPSACDRSARQRVLVVDDSTSQIKEMLETMSLEVDLAKSAREGCR
jgi:hypothetical protein